MRFGLFMIPTDRTITPDGLAVEAEARGFESVFFTEHTHVPTSRESPFPAGGELPDQYRRVLDPFVSLASAAQATERIGLGTGVCLVAQHDPITLAKTVATLDVLSQGRVLLGVGFGWNLEEARNHGIDPARRRAVTREKVMAMRALWTREAAAFAGEHVRFSESWSWPKPVRPGGPPVLLGGDGPQTLAAVAEYGDGWMPIGGANLAPRLAELARLAEGAGRDPAHIEVTVFGALPHPDKLDRYDALGVDRVVFMLPSAGRDAVCRAIDRIGAVVEGRAGPVSGGGAGPGRR